VDACASSEDTTLDRYISAEWDGSAIATNLLSAGTRVSLDFKKEILWINPPFTDRLIEGIMDVVLSTGVRAMMIIPQWANHMFWHNACAKCCQMVHVGRSREVFEPSSQYSFAKRTPNWDSTLFGFNFKAVRPGRVWEINPVTLELKRNEQEYEATGLGRRSDAP
jgi:hypothetical protein